jgi:hypothetical protein
MTFNKTLEFLVHVTGHIGCRVARQSPFMLTLTSLTSLISVPRWPLAQGSLGDSESMQTRISMYIPSAGASCCLAKILFHCGVSHSLTRHDPWGFNICRRRDALRYNFGTLSRPTSSFIPLTSLCLMSTCTVLLDLPPGSCSHSRSTQPVTKETSFTKDESFEKETQQHLQRQIS